MNVIKSAALIVGSCLVVAATPPTPHSDPGQRPCYHNLHTQQRA